MKKSILLFGICASAFLTSCASTTVAKQEIETGKEVRGSWTLTNVDYEGLTTNEVQGNVKVTDAVSRVFDTANPECYEGSTWNLVQNNKKGTYTFNNAGGDCPSGTANIIWNLQQDGSTTFFIFKDVTGIKAKQNTAGYKIRVDYVDANSMRLVQDINAKGKIAQVIYNFQR
ncbi:lipocalin family protein [Empedobacter falsenii]|uniref:lipocalin family protein n=1 Tax=Empedobacter stercoris TaxID=1628248 RepID=UPI001CE02FAF|nr:lipocalin family protein [Empedobacter stercoris]MCA4782130.1 lipocalin family protein [Empedobacter stercoris]